MSKLKLRKMKDRGKAEEDKLGTNVDGKSNDMRAQNSSEMIQRAVASAQKHNIELSPGKKNSGGGDCSYLSVIYNINERECFRNKFPLSPDYYRKIWNIDLMNKVLDKRIPWNPGLTRQEIQAGFQEIMEPGVYERSFFGDMMMVGIACGVKKRILIFNTNENTIHDPVSAVDPRDYGSDIDSEIPVIVAYNMVHFESLHPVTEKDIEETIKLINSYSSGRYGGDYGFTKEDMPYFASRSMVISNKKYHMQESETGQSRSSPPKKPKYLETVEDKDSLTAKKNADNTEKMEDFLYENILFKEMDNGKIRCGICKVECNRLIVHMNGNKYCTEYFSNMADFKKKYSDFRDKRGREKNRRKRKLESQVSSNTTNSMVIPQKDTGQLSKVHHKATAKDGGEISFRFGGFEFVELENGKIRCGVCQEECFRLMLHINGSVKCAENFSMSDLRTQYSRYKNNKSVRKYEAKKKCQIPKGSKIISTRE